MAGNHPRCGACRFLRQKCMEDCAFAPHFSYKEGDAHFATIHKVFGSRNFSRLFSQIPPSERGNAVMSFLYDAQTRIDDPTLGCVREILNLQQQVETLQAQVASLQAAQNSIRNILNSCTTTAVANVEIQDTNTQPQPSVPPSNIIPPEGVVGVEEYTDFDERHINELYERFFGSSSR